MHHVLKADQPTIHARRMRQQQRRRTDARWLELIERTEALAHACRLGHAYSKGI